MGFNWSNVPDVSTIGTGASVSSDSREGCAPPAEHARREKNNIEITGVLTLKPKNSVENPDGFCGKGKGLMVNSSAGKFQSCYKMKAIRNGLHNIQGILFGIACF